MSGNTEHMNGFQIQGTVTSEEPWLNGTQWAFEIQTHTHRTRLPQTWTVILADQQSRPDLKEGEDYLIFGWMEGNRNDGRAQLWAESTGDIHPVRSE